MFDFVQFIKQLGYYTKNLATSFREVFLEKHCKGVIHKAVCDYFFDAQSKVCSRRILLRDT